MSVIHPPFLQVLPADRRRVGPEPAAILALVRYVLDPAMGAYNGRLEIDREMWWFTSCADIARSLGGTTGESVRKNITRKLLPTGELLACQPMDWSGDQTKAYKLPSDQPIHKLATPLTSQSTNRPGGSTNRPGGSTNWPDPPAKKRIPIRNEELVERGEIGERTHFVRPGAQAQAPAPNDELNGFFGSIFNQQRRDDEQLDPW